MIHRPLLLLLLRAAAHTGPPAAAAACEDKELDGCPKWAANGECATNPDYMSLNCPASCHSCHVAAHPLIGVKNVLAEEELELLRAFLGRKKAECRDELRPCPHWAADGECEANPDFMLLRCPVSCHSCSGPRAACEDEHPSCGEWAENGECATKPLYMLVHCPVSCDSCPDWADRSGDDASAVAGKEGERGERELGREEGGGERDPKPGTAETAAAAEREDEQPVCAERAADGECATNSNPGGEEEEDGPEGEKEEPGPEREEEGGPKGKKANAPKEDEEEEEPEDEREDKPEEEGGRKRKWWRGVMRTRER